MFYYYEKDGKILASDRGDLSLIHISEPTRRS